MKTLTLFLIILRLTSAAPTPIKVDVNASPIPGAIDETGESTAESIAKIDLSDSGHCCFDVDRVLDKACDIPLCLKNFFTSEQGKPLADAILAAEEADPSFDIDNLVLPSENSKIVKGRTGKKVRRGNVVKAEGNNLQLSGTGGEVLATFSGNGGDLSQCTVQVMNDGSFGSDAPLCQQLLLDVLAPAAGCAHRKAGKVGNTLPSVKGNADSNIVKGPAGRRS